jgi:hypothetical protein
MNEASSQRLRNLGFAVMIGLILTGCSEQSAPPESVPQVQERENTSSGFINIVWKVSESSSVVSGTLYVFLSDGTLVVTSPHGKPTLGTWKDIGGILTMVEEGIPYQVDVLNLSHSQFKIRSHNPGKPAEILFLPAERPSRES